ncbi:MAG: hypothetical protein KAG64_01005 [Bacteroidales bacterium]|nr:hypothetical protein [Bacteroidales bacterium]
MEIKPTIKRFLIRFFIAGLLYASFMAWFSYSEGDPFHIWRFLFNAIFFGGFMGAVGVWEQKALLKYNKK